MRFNVRVKTASIVLGAVLVFGVAVPLVSGGANSGAVGHKSPVAKKSVVGKKSVVFKPVVKKPVVKKPVKKVVKKATVHTLALEVTYAAPSATLSAEAKSQLAALAKKLVTGASVTIHGYSKNSFSLSNRRAAAVEQYLKSKTKVKFKVKLIPSFTSKNGASVQVKQS
jgi:outer membrane protein OmpA-like peptidoglycan-associated protein